VQTPNFSNKRTSELISLFATRVTGNEHDPLAAMRAVIAQLRRRSRPIRIPVDLDPFFVTRNIAKFESVTDLSCDGFLQPCGTAFADGFQLVVKAGISAARSRFTVAHELCHTYFYEVVPELKFCTHETDLDEERLCNVGAAEILMPPNHLKKQARSLGVSLDTITALAGLYRVSSEAMFLRLRALKLCDSEFSVWHRMAGGGFVLHRLLGGRRVEWAWPDDSLLSKAWTSGYTLSGRTYLENRDAHGHLQLRPVSYELLRKRDSLIALLSRPSHAPANRKMPLFDAVVRQ